MDATGSADPDQTNTPKADGSSAGFVIGDGSCHRSFGRHIEHTTPPTGDQALGYTKKATYGSDRGIWIASFAIIAVIPD